jgi:hypothetical protein
MSEPAIRIAGRHLSVKEAMNLLDQYPPLTLSVYDGEPTATIADDVTPEDIGRLIVIEPLSQAVAIRLLNAGASFPWHKVPVDARLEDADPEGKLYADAIELFNAVDALENVGSAIASKILHIKRPHFFPILDSQLKLLYKEEAARAYQQSATWKSRQPEWGHLYWAAVRADLRDTGNVDALAILRQQLLSATTGADVTEHRRRLANLSNLRLMDILAWQISKPD